MTLDRFTKIRHEIIEAIQWNGSLDDLPAIIRGRVTACVKGKRGNSIYIGLNFKNGEICCDPGDWIIYFPDKSIQVMSDKRFLSEYEPVAQDILTANTNLTKELAEAREAIIRQQMEHDIRVTELLEANNREVERRRKAEDMMAANAHAHQRREDAWADARNDIRQYAEQWARDHNFNNVNNGA